MKVDLFESIYSVSPKGRPKDVYAYLEEIRIGKYNDVISEIRVEPDKSKRTQIKKKLPCVAFTGVFKTRSIKGFSKPSGLLIMDFDDVKDTPKLKAIMMNDKYTFSAFLSPSGGLKTLHKIPEVASPEEYKSRYISISNYYEKLINGLARIDTTSDVSRLCFMSSDPDLYLNSGSEVYNDIDLEKTDIEVNIGTVTNIPLLDHDEIANRLVVWWKSKHYNLHEVNNSLFKLAIAFNNFGVDKTTALNYCLQFKKEKAPVKEVESVVNSAYKHTATFNTKQFVDSNKRKKLDALILKGGSEKEIIKEFPEYNPDNIKNEIKARKSDLDIDIFWTYDENGKILISPHRYKFYLESKNFMKHYPVNERTFTFVRKEDNFIDEIYDNQIKDYVLKTLMKRSEMDVFDYMAGSTKVFDSNFLSMLEEAEFVMNQDTKESAFLYFKNYAVKVTANEKVDLIDYEDLDGLVWKKQVINRNYIKADHHESEYRTFIWRCAGENKNNYNSLKSVIGYLLHSYKDGLNNKAIVFNDELISDNPNGGSGKSLFCDAVGKIKKVDFLDGKTFDFQKTFPYQTVGIDTQVLVFDDVKKNFKFENLFSVITQGITLEYKNQPAVKLSVKDSPKIVITTNYTIEGSGGSFERRIFEIEMSSHYNANYTPFDEFGRMLFDDWDADEWARFDQFMINCLQYYLQNGLVAFEYENLDVRRIMNETDPQFLDWVEDNLILNDRIVKKDYFYKFKTDNSPDFDKMQTTHIFSKWLKAYADYKGYEYEENSANGERWFMFVDKSKPVEDPEPEVKDDPNELPF